MGLKVMIDANVVLDYTLKREHFEPARKILKFAVEHSIEGYVTPSIVHICGYWLTKAYGRDKGKRLILALLDDVNSLDIRHETIVTALHSSITDMEDALQYYTALHHKLDIFISRDRQLKKEALSSLPVYTPEQFLKEIS